MVQVLFFFLYLLTAILFHARLNRHPTAILQESKLPWLRHLAFLYLTSLLILVRCIYRLIEYSQGTDGYLISHEWCMYVFDCLLMIIVMITFAAVHPSEINSLLRGEGFKIHRIFLIKHSGVPSSEEWVRLAARQ